MATPDLIRVRIDDVEPHLSAQTTHLKGLIGDPKLIIDQNSDIDFFMIYEISAQIQKLKTPQKKIIIHSLSHYSEHLYFLSKLLKKEKIISHGSKCVLITNDFFYQEYLESTDNVIYHDPIRFYYGQFFRNIIPNDLCWMHNEAKKLKYWPITSEHDLVYSEKTKIFLSPCRLYLDQDRTKYRKKLFEELFRFKHRGFMSGPGRSEIPGVIEQMMNWSGPSMILVPETFDINIQQKIENYGFIPPNTQYYKDTFISIYSETLETGLYVAPTEKSLIPLWRGHLIFPFASHRTIKALRSQGFKFPDNHIDYSYDLEPNDELRWALYKKELNRLLELSMNKWQEIWTQTYQMRLDNQQLCMLPYPYLDMSEVLAILEQGKIS